MVWFGLCLGIVFGIGLGLRLGLGLGLGLELGLGDRVDCLSSSSLSRSCPCPDLALPPSSFLLPFFSPSSEV